jgi:LacI family transcriptional regulator
MSTISDVAKRAGVSSMTVSRVINNSGYTSPNTRARVEQAIAELGYVPNALARGLRFKQTKTIALVMTDITNPFFTTLARGVEDTANQAGFTVIFCNTDESETKEHSYLQMLLQQQVDGILLVPARSNSAESVKVIKKQNTPVIVLDRRVPPHTDVDVVRCDSEDAAQRLVHMLIELGHRRIGVLSGPKGVSTADDRVQGYRNALRHAGIVEHKNLIYRGSFTQESGYEIACQLLDVNPRPTAIFAAHNFFAPGVLKRARELNLRVPEDLAIVAFDDLPWTLAHAPFFTVAIQPAYEIGKQAAQLLFQRLNGTADKRHQEIILPVEIVIRESSGPPHRERAHA